MFQPLNETEKARANERFAGNIRITRVEPATKADAFTLAAAAALIGIEGEVDSFLICLRLKFPKRSWYAVPPCDCGTPECRRPYGTIGYVAGPIVPGQENAKAFRVLHYELAG